LKRHVTIHESEKPYKCSKCPFSSARLSNLNIHMQNIHPNEKLYKCEECSECFALSGTYQVPIRGIKEFFVTFTGLFTALCLNFLFSS
jgi:KRAB domain-containing zinc finger protein